MHDSLALVIAAAHISAFGALWTGIFTAFGQARVASSAVESIARQPEAAGTLRTTMLVGLAMCETAGIYGLLIAFIMLFANPLVAIFLANVR